MRKGHHIVLAVAAAIALLWGGSLYASDMSFFVTSAGSGRGGDLGGLEGADKICKMRAESVGAGGGKWHAYLSTQGPYAVNARDRIGKGPWVNAMGVVVAKDLNELHGEPNNINKQTALTEKGEIVPGRGDVPNKHDILTGSRLDGMAFGPEADRTCSNWMSGTVGAAMVGHSDRMGLDNSAAARSWNSSHPSRGPDGGCSQADLRSTGGDGLFYCFADK